MKVTMKTERLLAVYRMLSAARCNKMDDADKIRIWKIQRSMKPVAVKFEEDVRSANETLRPDGFDELLEKARRIEDAEKSEFGEIGTPEREREFVDMLTAKNPNYAAFQRKRREYVSLCNVAVKDYAEKEVQIEFDKLSEEAFAKFVSSNDWTLDQISTVADYICE